MRIIDGYVIVQQVAGCYTLFGQSKESTGRFCRFEDNGLLPFRELGLALGPARSFLNQGMGLPEQTYSARLHLEIAESWDDLDALTRTRYCSFIVVFGDEEEYQLLGQRLPEKPGVFDCGERLCYGAAPFASIEEALHLRDEACRQGRSPSAVAFYRLRLFPDVHANRIKVEICGQKKKRPKW